MKFGEPAKLHISRSGLVASYIKAEPLSSYSISLWSVRNSVEIVKKLGKLVKRSSRGMLDS